MDKKPESVTVKSHPQSLKQIRTLITDVTCRLAIPSNTAGNIILAVDEVCSNIIRHGYKNDTEQKIRLTIHCSPNQLIIEILDSGACFDLTLAEPRDPADIKPGGLGVYIIKQVMDDVEYGQTNTGLNRTRLIKNLQKKLKP